MKSIAEEEGEVVKLFVSCSEESHLQPASTNNGNSFLLTTSDKDTTTGNIPSWCTSLMPAAVKHNVKVMK